MTIHDFDPAELDKLINYAYSIKDNQIPSNFIDPKIISEQSILPYKILEIDLMLRTISDWNKELIVLGADRGEDGGLFKQGKFLERFVNRGGFVNWAKHQTTEKQRMQEREDSEHKANIATIDSAKTARKALLWAIIATIVSIAALLTSIFRN